MSMFTHTRRDRWEPAPELVKDPPPLAAPTLVRKDRPRVTVGDALKTAAITHALVFAAGLALGAQFLR